MTEKLERELAKVKAELERANKRITNLERALASAATDKVKLFVSREMWRLMLAGVHPDRGGRASTSASSRIGSSRGE